MDSRLRKSIWSKITAILMIYMVLCGNIWFTLLVIGKGTPLWLTIAARSGALLLLVSGFGLVTHALYLRYYLKSDHEWGVETE